MADLILFIHVLFTGTVIFSVPLIIMGGLLHWRWVRNPWFRYTHLGMICFVAAEAIIGMNCPLTVWENALRISNGESGYGDNDFIGTMLGKLLYYPFPHWVFTATYIAFALLVAVLFYLVPPYRKSVRS